MKNISISDKLHQSLVKDAKTKGLTAGELAETILKKVYRIK